MARQAAPTDVTEIVDGVTQYPTRHDAWPFYRIREGEWRNGREAGAWLAGVVVAIPEKCARVELDDKLADGAALAMLNGGLRVESFAHSDTTSVFAVCSAFAVWGAEPTSYAVPDSE